MKIHEHYKSLRNDLNNIFGTEVDFREYGNTTCGENIIRGMHITLMIPVKGVTVGENSFQEAVNLIDENLCDITWDGIIKYHEVSGIYNGWYYEITLDIKEGNNEGQ